MHESVTVSATAEVRGPIAASVPCPSSAQPDMHLCAHPCTPPSRLIGSVCMQALSRRQREHYRVKSVLLVSTKNVGQM